MTRDDVIRMAREAGAYPLFSEGNYQLSGDAAIERFAALIEAAATEKANELADQRVVAEREACTKACEEQERGAGDAMTFYTATGQCAAAIRNRKDTTE